MNGLNILGHFITLNQLDKSQLKGVNIGEWLSYSFYDGNYRGVDLLFMKPKQSNPSPRICAITADRLYGIFNKPVVFILNPGPTYERQRLIDKNVFFVMGEKFAHLPMLIANERIRKTKPASRLTPVAQYILLYHLQVENMDGLSARDMAGRLPYSYESITLGLTCLSDLGLCEKTASRTRANVIRFAAHGRELWDMSREYMINPVDKRVYCDAIESDIEYTNCSINALSHYSRLNPDNIRMIMMNRKQLQSLLDGRHIYNPNEFDGNVMIEVWKYPVVSAPGCENEWVDKLSLVLSLSDDHDARVEGEVEHVINEMKW